MIDHRISYAIDVYDDILSKTVVSLTIRSSGNYVGLYVDTHLIYLGMSPDECSVVANGLAEHIRSKGFDVVIESIC